MRWRGTNPYRLIKAAPYDFTIAHNDGTHRHLACCFSLLREQQGCLHKDLISVSHG